MMSFITGSDINILSKEKTAIVLRRFARQTWLRKRIYHTAQKLSKRLSQVFLAKRHNTTAISALIGSKYVRTLKYFTEFSTAL